MTGSRSTGLPHGRRPNRAAGRLVYDDTTYFFCTLTCAGAFAQGPGRFIG
jgi:YHS domain-containing protein